MRNVVIVGGGFAGVWAALAAARERAARTPTRPVNITLVSPEPWLTMRPRLYESSPQTLRVPLAGVLGPAGVVHVAATVRQIDTRAQTVTADTAFGQQKRPWDRLILAAGSRLHRPPVPGADLTLSVDSYADALALDTHLSALPLRAEAERYTAVVVGTGFTGIEVATELVTRLRRIAARARVEHEVRVILVERAPAVAPDLGPEARDAVESALAELGIQARVQSSVAEVQANGVRLDSGEWIPAATTVWTGGFRASELAAQLNVARDPSGRVPVDKFLRVQGVEGVLAAGDVARAMADETHVAPMSCQYAIPMGELAGRNVVAELLGDIPQPFAQPHYVTCLDLGAAGALFMQGWNRALKLTGFWAKVMKETINTRLIYPPQVDPGTTERHPRREARAA